MPLQFGHACLRVETTGRLADALPCSLLQFGHACLRVETVKALADEQAKQKALQFGHACLRVETALTTAYRKHSHNASIRPRLLARGDRNCGEGIDVRELRFNSATPACAWRRLRPSLCRSRGTPASIRPRLLARGDSTPPKTTRDSTSRLQFGHACLRVETLPYFFAFRRTTRFNSATPACAWRRGMSRFGLRPRRCFNSATPACAWRQA